MYAVGDSQSDMSLVGDVGGEGDLSHVCSRRHISLVGDLGGKDDLCLVGRGGNSVTHIPSREWGKRRISAMYTVGDARSEMSLLGNGG